MSPVAEIESRSVQGVEFVSISCELQKHKASPLRQLLQSKMQQGNYNIAISMQCVASISKAVVKALRECAAVCHKNGGRIVIYDLQSIPACIIGRLGKDLLDYVLDAKTALRSFVESDFWTKDPFV